MVALPGLLEPIQMCPQILLGEEGGPVHALQALSFLVALPVGTRHGEQLERLDATHGRHVRAAAEVDEALSGLVDGDQRVIRLLLDQLALHELALLAVLGERLVARDPDALVPWIALDDLPHAGLDHHEVLGSERLLAIHVVEEALLRRRADPELGLGIQFQSRGGKQVGRGMPVHLQRLLVPVGEEPQAGILLQRRSKIRQLPIDFRDQGGTGQTGADALGDLERGRSLRDLHLAAVRKSDCDVGHSRKRTGVRASPHSSFSISRRTAAHPGCPRPRASRAFR